MPITVVKIFPVENRGSIKAFIDGSLCSPKTRRGGYKNANKTQ